MLRGFRLVPPAALAAVVTVGRVPPAFAGWVACTSADAPAAYSGASCTLACAVSSGSMQCGTTAGIVPLTAMAVSEFGGAGVDVSVYGMQGTTAFCCAYEDSDATLWRVRLIGTVYDDSLALSDGSEALKPIGGRSMEGFVDAYLGSDTVTGSNSPSAQYSERLLGSFDEDFIYGLAGADEVDAGGSDDLVWGGAGDDVIEAGLGADQCRGGDGDDELVGGDGADQLWGGDDDDLLQGGDHDDVLYGESGADTMLGESGDDTLTGGSGADILWGGSGADALDGETGNDLLCAGSDSGVPGDSMTGGGGTDTLWKAFGGIVTGFSGETCGHASYGIYLGTSCSSFIYLPPSGC